MFRISFHLGGPSHVVFDQHALGNTAQRIGRGEEERLAGNEFFGRGHVGHDGLVWLLRTSSQTGQRERCAHQMEETAPPYGVRPLI